MQLPSYSSSSNMTSSLPTFPSSLSPMYPSPSHNTSMLNQSHIAQPYLSHSLNSSSSSQNYNLPKTGGQNDETFKLLQKHYMDAIHTLTPQQKLNVSNFVKNIQTHEYFAGFVLQKRNDGRQVCK